MKTFLTILTKFTVSIVFYTVLSTTVSSCYLTRTTVGNGPVSKEDTVVTYSKTKQTYALWGFAALNKAEPKKPDNNYQIISYYGIEDVIVSCITFGIFSMRTTKVLVKSK